MTARRIMIQGTGSGVGKSVITASLCRYFYEEGFRVAPFKSQNMSNNSYVTAVGGEIGRAQAFQAQACGIEPTVDMNPILLKPSSDMGSQVVVLGKAVKTMNATQYHKYQSCLTGVIRASLEKLLKEYDIVVIEGAGSPAEINLRPFDIANMAIAQMAAAPVLLVGDINLGGVFASLVGTLELLTAEERSFVKGFLINKFRGDISLLDDGLTFLTRRTGKKVFGVLPFMADLLVPEEDGLPESKWTFRTPHDPEKLRIEVILLPHISNSTDFESLEREPDMSLQFLRKAPISTLPDLLILPGSKSTVFDLAYLRSSGFSNYIDRCHRARVPIVGICGGYQMLGTEILDPDCIESPITRVQGLGLLDAVTTFERDKRTVRVRARTLNTGYEFMGYEIHMGQTTGKSTATPWCEIISELGRPVNRFDGAKSEDGLVWGTYLHGLFDSAEFRRAVLNDLRDHRKWPRIQPVAVGPLSRNCESLSALIRQHVDLNALNDLLTERL
jgi:adenosylcobyric acid synthase